MHIRLSLPAGATDTENGQIDKTLSAILDNLPLSFYQEKLTARNMVQESESKASALIAKALEESSRILGEDCARESGYIIPQIDKTKELLKDLLESADENQKAFITKLLEIYKP